MNFQTLTQYIDNELAPCMMKLKPTNKSVSIMDLANDTLISSFEPDDDDGFMLFADKKNRDAMFKIYKRFYPEEEDFVLTVSEDDDEDFTMAQFVYAVVAAAFMSNLTDLFKTKNIETTIVLDQVAVDKIKTMVANYFKL